MPRRSGGRGGTRRPATRADKAALSFYNAKLRDDPPLRRSCSDRHVLDETIDAWKAGQRLDGCGSQIAGISRAAIINNLRVRWKLVDSKVTEENVVIWTADVAGNDRAREISRVVERVQNSRTELEEDRNGIIIDRFDDWEDRICRPGERLTRRIAIRNSSDVDFLCAAKGDAATQRGFVIDGDTSFELPGGGSRHIDVSFAARGGEMGVKKSLVVFDFRAVDFDDDDDDDGGESAAGATFSIARYIFLRVGDPDDFDILKPFSPYVRTRKRYYDGDKFSNPVRVVRPDDGGARPTPFVRTLATYPIPPELAKLASFEVDATREKFDGMFRGGDGEGFIDARYQKVDYPSYLNIENYATCMQHLMWMEEVQMRGASSRVFF
jgi:hypothetical protein